MIVAFVWHRCRTRRSAGGHDPAGIHRLFRIGSTSKSVTAVTAKVMEERGDLSLEDFVNDQDGKRVLVGGVRTLRDLLSHRGAFHVDNGGVYLFCYPGDLAAFWAEPDVLVSPLYTSSPYGNLGGGYEYSAFNFSLAGAYLAHRGGAPFGSLIQSNVFDAIGMCTATVDGTRAVSTAIGRIGGISQAAAMHVGPYINLYSRTDPRCRDNYYSSSALPGDAYTWLPYNLDEASSPPRDPAGGVIASAIDLAHFASALLDSYHGRGGPISPQGVRDLWRAGTDLGASAPYELYYGLGFFTNSVTGENITQVGHGGSRAGFASAFVIRPQADAAVCILANADVSTVTLSNLAKTNLDDFGD